jgi:hypothetical protein
LMCYLKELVQLLVSYEEFYMGMVKKSITVTERYFR